MLQGLGFEATNFKLQGVGFEATNFRHQDLGFEATNFRLRSLRLEATTFMHQGLGVEAKNWSPHQDICGNFESNNSRLKVFPTMTQLDRASTLALRPFTLDFCLGGKILNGSREAKGTWYK